MLMVRKVDLYTTYERMNICGILNSEEDARCNEVPEKMLMRIAAAAFGVIH